MGLIRTLAIILLVYFVLRIFSRWIAPKVFGYAARKAEERIRDMYGMNGERNSEAREAAGSVSVDKSAVKGKKDTEKVGEYIEFEEIE